MIRSILFALITVSALIQAPDAEAMEPRAEEMARCRSAMKFWPRDYPQMLANYVQSDLASAPKVACERVVAGVLAGRIKSGDFGLKAFYLGSPPELMNVLRGH
jgi:hypothetical protein